MSKLNFKIEKKLDGALGRAGVISTPHGDIETPAFIVVGTKATVKEVKPEEVKALGGQVVLSNTYHLYLQPGPDLVAKAGGLHKFMNWPGPMMTDSGGFQVFSLGAAYGKGGVSKVAKGDHSFVGVSPSNAPTGNDSDGEEKIDPLAKITEEGVHFRSHIDGSAHFIDPEKSMEIQHKLGADIIFAFDECTSPMDDYDYQKEAMERTHRWAERSLAHHQKLNSEAKLPGKGLGGEQALFGIVQGGRFQDLREESARVISAMSVDSHSPAGEGGFDGFGIGGSFGKEDLGTAVGWVNKILPEDKPRHLLGIGEPEDLFLGVEQGCDTFDCVIPTRLGRHGTVFTKHGKTSLLNSQYREDMSPIEEGCGCYTCQHYSKAYLAHLFRAKEFSAGALGSIHNLYFLVNLAKQIRQSILEGRFGEFKEEFLKGYKKID